jgi:hypothetical protein
VTADVQQKQKKKSDDHVCHCKATTLRADRTMYIACSLSHDSQALPRDIPIKETEILIIVRGQRNPRKQNINIIMRVVHGVLQATIASKVLQEAPHQHGFGWPGCVLSVFTVSSASFSPQSNTRQRAMLRYYERPRRYVESNGSDIA